MTAIEVANDRGTKKPIDGATVAAVYEGAYTVGAMVRVSGSNLILSPPLVLTEADVNTILLTAVQVGYFDTTVTELATRINLTHEACYRALRALCDDGRMVRTGRGQYSLT